MYLTKLSHHPSPAPADTGLTFIVVSSSSVLDTSSVPHNHRKRRRVNRPQCCGSPTQLPVQPLTAGPRPDVVRSDRTWWLRPWPGARDRCGHESRWITAAKDSAQQTSPPGYSSRSAPKLLSFLTYYFFSKSVPARAFFYARIVSTGKYRNISPPRATTQNCNI
jgi:hypothetical protein